jgi:hypothetical protein
VITVEIGLTGSVQVMVEALEAVPVLKTVR